MGNREIKSKKDVLSAIENELKQFSNINGYRYNCFYRALAKAYSLNSFTNRILWQDAVIEYMISDSGSIREFYNKVAESTKLLPQRKYLPVTDRPGLDAHLKKPFPTISKGKQTDLEHAIKFNLLHKRHAIFGEFISYEVDVVDSVSSGRIDCIAYKEQPNGQKNELRLIEIKRYGLPQMGQNEEMFLRAYSEIFTYRACFDNYDKEFLKREFEKTGYSIDFDNLTVTNCIFGPKTMFENIDKRFIDYINEAKAEYGVELYEIFPTGGIKDNSVGCKEILTTIKPISLS